MKIGKYSINIVNSGYFGLDGGAMFGIIPKPLWKNTNSADDKNRVKLATRNLLLVSDSKKILIDTGMGNKWDEKSRKIYDINQEETSLQKGLAEHNLTKSDITDVILTHLHFDHTGGSVNIENDKLVPAFPDAKYYVQEENFNWAMNPSKRDKGSYLKNNFEPLVVEGILNFINGEEDFDDDISFLVINGHTFGQQMIKISDSSNTILYCADLIPFVSHLRLPYIMGYDLQPLETLKEKQKYLPIALEGSWKLFFEHDPETAFVTLKDSVKGITVNERFESV